MKKRISLFIALPLAAAFALTGCSAAAPVEHASKPAVTQEKKAEETKPAENPAASTLDPGKLQTFVETLREDDAELYGLAEDKVGEFIQHGCDELTARVPMDDLAFGLKKQYGTSAYGTGFILASSVVSFCPENVEYMTTELKRLQDKVS